MISSLDYRTPEPFAGQKVLVIGLGSSAVDIAGDLVGVAHQVTLSTRRGAWIAPRYVNGRPLDHRGTRLSWRLPAAVRASRRRRLLEREYARRWSSTPEATLPGIWGRANVPFDPATGPSVTSDHLIPNVISGAITLRPGIARIEHGEVVFADANRSRPDTVIFATGYELDFPFLTPDVRPWTTAAGGLYRLVFSPRHPTLAFIGVCRAQGPIFPIVEMQARWVASVLAGKSRLPPATAMLAEIARRSKRQPNTLPGHGDAVIRVPLLPYLDEVAAELDARPTLWKHPLLAGALLTGPPVAAQYRLEGPNRWVGAEDTIRAAQVSEPSVTIEHDHDL